MRGTFSPGCGDLKPNTLAIRRLLLDEGSRCVERKEWQLIKDEEDMDVESIQESESEDQA
jgi:hypothetical protein